MRKHAIHLEKETGRYYAKIKNKGPRKTFWLGTVKKKAIEELADIENDIANGKLNISGSIASRPANGSADINIKDLAHHHLEWVEQNRSAGTYEQRRQYVKLFIKFAGDCMVSSIDLAVLEKFYVWAKKNHGYSLNAGNICLRHVKTMFLWAKERDFCPLNIRRFPKMKEAASETKFFSKEEVKLLLEKADTDFRDMLIFGVLTGLRPQEIRPLQRDHIKYNADGKAFISLDVHKTSSSAKSPKPRVVYLGTYAENIMHRQVESHPDSPYIFLAGRFKSEIRVPYTASVFRRRLKRLCERAKVKKLPPYALRHSFASWLAFDGINQKFLADMLGHSTTRVTERYVHATAEHLRTVASDFESRLSGAIFASSEKQNSDQKCPQKCPQTQIEVTDTVVPTVETANK